MKNKLIAILAVAVIVLGAGMAYMFMTKQDKVAPPAGVAGVDYCPVDQSRLVPCSNDTAHTYWYTCPTCGWQSPVRAGGV